MTSPIDIYKKNSKIKSTDETITLFNTHIALSILYINEGNYTGAKNIIDSFLNSFNETDSEFVTLTMNILYSVSHNLSHDKMSDIKTRNSIVTTLTNMIIPLNT